MGADPKQTIEEEAAAAGGEQILAKTHHQIFTKREITCANSS